MRSDKLLSIYQDISAFLQKEMGDTSFFCVVYGSYPGERANAQSDVDLFVATTTPSPERFEKLKDFIIALHETHHLVQDEEVPYENKLLVSYEDVGRAVSLNPFTTDGRAYVVPPIEKTSAFLNSLQVRERLIFNALTTPHEFIAGNVHAYLSAREAAEYALLTLATALTLETQPSVDACVDALLYSKDSDTGELYLGYKDVAAVRAYLRYLLSKVS